MQYSLIVCNSEKELQKETFTVQNHRSLKSFEFKRVLMRFSNCQEENEIYDFD